MPDVADEGCWVGFDLGGTKMLATVYDADFRELGRCRRKTRGHDGAQAGMERIAETIRRALLDAEVEPAWVRGIGVGCPGPLDLDEGVMLDAPNLGWKDVAVRAALEREFGCRTVIANDVDAGVYGENRFGAARGSRCVLGVFPGTGIGGGCVYEGRIVRGRTSSCMEIGHLRVVPDGPRCGCGLYGCLEAVASRLVIAAEAAQAAYRGQAPHLLETAGTDLSKIRSGMLADAIKAGDDVIEAIVRRAAEYIGEAVASTVHLLAPDRVVLGGGLVAAMPDLFATTVEKSAREHVLPSYRDSFHVVPAELGDNATALGAAAWSRTTLAARETAAV